MNLLAFSSHQFAPRIVDPSIYLLHPAIVLFFLVRERSERRKPPWEGSEFVFFYSGSDAADIRPAVSR